MARIGSGTSVLGRQLLANRGSGQTSFYLAIGQAGDVDPSFKGYLVLEYVHPNSENAVIQMIAKPVWGGGAHIMGSEDNPASRPRRFVMFWKKAGLVWRAENTSTI